LFETKLISDCIKGDRQAQSTLYAMFVSKMFVVCLRYAKSKEEAEEILQEGFLKAFRFLHQFKREGSLEGWIRKIMVNCALQKLRNKSRMAPVISIESYHDQFVIDEYIESSMGSKELLKLVMILPPAYKMVFNLYVFEGYKHREIADILGITEGTSKSNLADARAFLQKRIVQKLAIAK